MLAFQDMETLELDSCNSKQTCDRLGESFMSHLVDREKNIHIYIHAYVYLKFDYSLEHFTRINVIEGLRMLCE